MGSLVGTHSPRTCCSRLRMTATAWCRTRSLVWGFSLLRWSWHMWPSSLKASLMSRTRRRSRALLAILLSRSRSAFCSGLRSSSSWILQRQVGEKNLGDQTQLCTVSIVEFCALCWSHWIIKTNILMLQADWEDYTVSELLKIYAWLKYAWLNLFNHLIYIK